MRGLYHLSAHCKSLLDKPLADSIFQSKTVLTDELAVVFSDAI